MNNKEAIQKMDMEDLASFLAGKFDCVTCPVINCEKQLSYSCSKKIMNWLEEKVDCCDICNDVGVKLSECKMCNKFVCYACLNCEVVE